MTGVSYRKPLTPEQTNIQRLKARNRKGIGIGVLQIFVRNFSAGTLILSPRATDTDGDRL